MTRTQFLRIRAEMDFVKQHGVTACPPGSALTSSATFASPRKRSAINRTAVQEAQRRLLYGPRGNRGGTTWRGL